MGRWWWMMGLVLAACVGESPPGEMDRPDAGRAVLIRRPHVLLLTIDTLRADYLSLYGYDRPTTPYLDQLLSGGVHFPRTVAPVPRTTPALASLHTGRYPHGTGVRTLYDHLADHVPTLAERMDQRGYHTVAVVSNHVLTPKRRLDRGFSIYNSAEDTRDASATTDTVFRIMGAFSREDPIFLWVHFIDPHVPYLPPADLAKTFDPGYSGPYAEGFGSQKGGIGDLAYPPDLPKVEAVYRNPLSEETNAHIRRLYAADIRATDDQVARLVEGLRTRFRNDWTIIFTADHGEALGEQEYYFDHGDYVDDQSLTVPLGFVLPPGDPLARSARIDMRVSLVDVAPTLVELLELDPLAETEGRSLMPALLGHSLPPRPVYAESGTSFFPARVRKRKTFDIAGRFRAVYLESWKLIWTPGVGWELYDLDADPLERRNLYLPGEPRAEELRHSLHAWVRPTDRTAAGPEPEDLQRLRSLGYLP